MDLNMSEYMRQLLQSMSSCKLFSNESHTNMLPALTELGFTTDNNLDTVAFRVFHTESTYGVSVSVAPDINRYCTKINNVTYETALWDKESNSLVYNEFMGYDDVRRFDSLSEVLEELQRVLKYSKEESEEDSKEESKK
jgi:hypothetical protein